jgi:hypothetical protein
MKVRVHQRNGHYWLQRWTQAHARVGRSFVEISDSDWRDYQAYVASAREWNEWMQRLESEQYAKDHPHEPAR